MKINEYTNSKQNFFRMILFVGCMHNLSTSDLTFRDFCSRGHRNHTANLSTKGWCYTLLWQPMLVELGLLRFPIL